MMVVTATTNHFTSFAVLLGSIEGFGGESFNTGIWIAVVCCIGGVTIFWIVFVLLALYYPPLRKIVLISSGDQEKKLAELEKRIQRLSEKDSTAGSS
jgi:hypothetical protein